MGIKSMLFDGKSKNGRAVFTQMLSWLDSPVRLKYDNPEALVRASGITPGQTVLEMGCGSGFFTPAISKLLGESGKLAATDLHPVAVEETLKKAAALGLKNVVVQQDDGMHSTLPDGMFDVVLLYGLVPAPIISLKDISCEIYRLLKPGGIYAIWTKIPFWSPTSVIHDAPFEALKKNHDVFRFRKLKEGL